MENLKVLLSQYRELTEKINLSLENDNYDKLDELLNKRGELIEYIDRLKYSQNEFIKISEEIGLAILEEKLNIAFINKRIELKNNLNKLNKGSNVNKTYNKKYSVDSIFLNKKL